MNNHNFFAFGHSRQQIDNSLVPFFGSSRIHGAILFWLINPIRNEEKVINTKYQHDISLVNLSLWPGPINQVLNESKVNPSWCTRYRVISSDYRVDSNLLDNSFYFVKYIIRTKFPLIACIETLLSWKRDEREQMYPILAFDENNTRKNVKPFVSSRTIGKSHRLEQIGQVVGFLSSGTRSSAIIKTVGMK